MHELAVCQALVREVEAVARGHGARRVLGVEVRVGPLSGVEARLLERAYPLACAGSLAEGAALRLETPPIRVRCPRCAVETECTNARLVCGRCGDWRTELTSGQELELARVELEA